MKKLITIISILFSSCSPAFSQYIAENGDAPISNMMNVNFGQANYFAMGYTLENNRKIHWIADIQGTDEIGLQITGGYRIGTEMYNISPMIGATQFFNLENEAGNKGVYFQATSFTGSIRAQVWIFDLQFTKRSKQDPIISFGLRGNIFK